VCFGSSAMNSVVESGVLRGRPFGGVMTLIHKKLQTVSRVICATERCVIVVVSNLLIANIYLPCVGVIDRLFICDEVFQFIFSWMGNIRSC
jgi:exonuclease III